MIETIRLFDEDSHQTLFEGCVLSCEQEGDLYKVTLNQTMFFPEEGGQSADKHHDQGENLVRRLGGPGVSEEVAHIGAGIEEDADEGREAEQPQDHGYENDA